MYAAVSMGLAFVVMHLAGADEGGIFGFGFSTLGQQVFIIAYFGVRPFHITDTKHQFSYGDYAAFRALTVSASMAAAFIFACLMWAVGNYSAHKAVIIFLLALLKAADGVADLYESECQRCGMLWLGGKELFFRSLAAAFVFSTVLAVTGSLFTASVAALMVHAAVITWFRGYCIKRLPDMGKEALNRRAVRALLHEAGLLFLSVFLDFYILSAAKYAIDFFMTNTDSGVFNILFMPTQVIYLVSNFIIRPCLTGLSSLYDAGETDSFAAEVKKLFRLVAVLSVLAVAAALLLGKPALGLIELVLGNEFGGLFTSRSAELVLIVLGGAFYAVSCLYYYVLVIMRAQRQVFINDLLVSAAAFAATAVFVPMGGTTAAAIVYPVYMLMLAGTSALTAGRKISSAGLKAARRAPQFSKR